MAKLRRKYRKGADGQRVLQGFMGEFYDASRHPPQRRISLGTRDEASARGKLVDLEREYALGLFDPWQDKVQRSGTTLEQARRGFLRSREGMSAKTLRGYESILTMFEKALPPGMTMQMLEQRHVMQFLDAKRTRPKGGQYRLSGTSRKSYVRHLRAFFRWAIAEGHMRDDPTPTAELNRKAARRTVPPFLHEDEFDGLIRVIESDGILNDDIVHGNAWLVNATRFAVGTGLRRGEVCNLRWSAVDLRNGFIYVKNIADDEGAIDFSTKTGEERAVPLVGDALEVVRALHDARRSEADGYVFTGAKGGQLNGDFLSKRFRVYRKRAGLSSAIHFHSLRHTFASWWVLRGGDLYRLKEVMGHSSIETTMIYAHLRPDALREEAMKTFGGVDLQNGPTKAARLQAKVEALEAELAALRASAAL